MDCFPTSEHPQRLVVADSFWPCGSFAVLARPRAWLLANDSIAAACILAHMIMLLLGDCRSWPVQPTPAPRRLLYLRHILFGHEELPHPPALTVANVVLMGFLWVSHHHLLHCVRHSTSGSAHSSIHQFPTNLECWCICRKMPV